MKIETIAVHAGREIDPTTGAVMPPIHLSTTFQRTADGSYPSGYSYIRADNPTRRALEDALVALEGGVAAATFGSGMAAIMALFQALRTGDHVIIPEEIYFGTGKLVRELFGPWGLEHSAVDMSNLTAVQAAMRPNTRLVWIETPSNPLLKMTDIAAVAEIAHLAARSVPVTAPGQRPCSSVPWPWGQIFPYTPPPNIWAAIVMYWAVRSSPTPRVTFGRVCCWCSAQAARCHRPLTVG